MAKSKVLILGATGETGKSILEGLLESGETEVEALIRPASINKPAVSKIKERGVAVRVGDISDSVEKLVPLLEGIDTVISAISAGNQLEQIPLIDAAKKAGVKRFVPCGFITVCPLGGVMKLRDDKEVVYQHIKKLGLGYTVIDVGFWYQLSFPTLPSGKVDYAIPMPNTTIYGEDNHATAITDLRDVGRYVAKIIADERTLNQYVFCYGEVLFQKDTFGILEELSGEKVERTYMTAEQLEGAVAAAKAAFEAEPTSFATQVGISLTQYCYSKYVRGDNTPEYAKYLGYLDARDLYPDFKPVAYKEFLKELLDGKGMKPYPDVKLVA